jgi:hypothetical protein
MFMCKRGEECLAKAIFYFFIFKAKFKLYPIRLRCKFVMLFLCFLFIILFKSLVAAKLNKSLAREAELDNLDSEISDQFKLCAEYDEQS